MISDEDKKRIFENVLSQSVDECPSGRRLINYEKRRSGLAILAMFLEGLSPQQIRDMPLDEIPESTKKVDRDYFDSSYFKSGIWGDYL